jgi:hypothetical protein
MRQHLEVRNKIVCTDRKGVWIQDLWVSDKERTKKQRELAEKHKGNIYFFAAPPSEAQSKTPLRKPGARSFVMGAHD